MQEYHGMKAFSTTIYANLFVLSGLGFITAMSTRRIRKNEAIWARCVQLECVLSDEEQRETFLDKQVDVMGLRFRRENPLLDREIELKTPETLLNTHQFGWSSSRYEVGRYLRANIEGSRTTF